MVGPPRRPQRRASDNHVHTEYWTEEDHYRFESRVTTELKELKAEVHGLANRLTLLLGGLGVVIFIVNIAVTFYLRTQL